MIFQPQPQVQPTKPLRRLVGVASPPPGVQEQGRLSLSFCPPRGACPRKCCVVWLVLWLNSHSGAAHWLNSSILQRYLLRNVSENSPWYLLFIFSCLNNKSFNLINLYCIKNNSTLNFHSPLYLTWLLLDVGGMGLLDPYVMVQTWLINYLFALM